MNHYVLAIKMQPRLSAANKRAFDRTMKDCSIKHSNYTSAMGDAMTLSNVNAVQFVVVVHVNETAMGVWRKGKRT